MIRSRCADFKTFELQPLAIPCGCGLGAAAWATAAIDVASATEIETAAYERFIWQNLDSRWSPVNSRRQGRVTAQCPRSRAAPVAVGVLVMSDRAYGPFAFEGGALGALLPG